MQNRFSAITPPHMVWYTSSTDHNVTSLGYTCCASLCRLSCHGNCKI